MTDILPFSRVRRLWLVATLAAGLCAVPLCGTAKPFWMQGTASDNSQDFLPPDVAFRVGAHLEGDQLRIRWIIAPGYYLYRNRIQVAPESADLALGPLQLPPGETVSDEWFGAQQIYRSAVEASVAVSRQDFGAHPVQVRVSYQGCAEAGLCYPLLAKVLFPDEPDAFRAPPGHPALTWEVVAILGGCLAFLLAGLWLGRERRAGPATP
jgi:thiol:disulfide interchange protein DsbD